MNALHIKNKNFLNLEEFELNMDEENFIIIRIIIFNFLIKKNIKINIYKNRKIFQRLLLVLQLLIMRYPFYVYYINLK